MGQTICVPNNKPTIPNNQITTPSPPSCNSASNQYAIQSGDTCYALGNADKAGLVLNNFSYY